MDKEEKKPPFKQSLYMDCLFEAIDQARRQGLEYIEFTDIDKLVVEKARRIIEYKLEGE